MGPVGGRGVVTGAVSLMLGGVGLSVSVSPNPVSNTGASSTVISVLVAATASGGSGSYTYQWIKSSGDNITVIDPLSPSTQFQASGMFPEEIRSAVFICRVTDSVSGIIKDSDSVSVTLARDPL